MSSNHNHNKYKFKRYCSEPLNKMGLNYVHLLIGGIFSLNTYHPIWLLWINQCQTSYMEGQLKLYTDLWLEGQAPKPHAVQGSRYSILICDFLFFNCTEFLIIPDDQVSIIISFFTLNWFETMLFLLFSLLSSTFLFLNIDCLTKVKNQ